jgi:hypothetical protein
MGLKVETTYDCQVAKNVKQTIWLLMEPFFITKIGKEWRFMKKLVVFIVLLTLVFTSSTLRGVSAKKAKVVQVPDQTVVFEGTVTIDNNTTQFELGFVKVTFRKNFVEEDLYPITFDVKIYAEEGEVYIEFTPGMDLFFKDVTIHAFNYNGYIFDVATGENIYVEIPNQVLKVNHFSRYCFAW